MIDIEYFVILFQTAPTAEEAGHCDEVKVDEIGDTPVIVFRQSKPLFFMIFKAVCLFSLRSVCWTLFYWSISEFI